MNDVGIDIFETRLARLIPASKPVDCVVYRSSTPRYATEDDVLTGEGSRKTGGRWNPVGTAVVYASLTPETAMAETFASFRYFGIPLEDAMPRTFVAIRARLRKVLDLSQGDVRKRLQVSLERILHVDWRKELQGGRVPVTQALGQAAFEVGLEGLLVPSAQARNGMNLLVFPSNLKEGSELTLLHKDRMRQS